MQPLLAPPIGVINDGILKTINRGLKENYDSEYMVNDILNNISFAITMVGTSDERKQYLKDIYKEIERSKLIRKYNMIYQSPTNNRLMLNLLNQLSLHFKARFSRYRF